MENMLEYAEKYFKEKYNREKVNPGAEHIMEQYGCTDEEFQNFLKNFLLANNKEKVSYKDDNKDYLIDENISFPKMSAYQFIAKNNHNRLDTTAINYYGQEISYGEFLEKIDTCAKGLDEWGVKKGDIVSMCSLSTPEGLILFYALNKLGATVHMINISSAKNEMIEQIKSVKSTKFITHDLLYSSELSSTLKEAGIEKVLITTLTNSLDRRKNRSKTMLKMVTALKSLSSGYKLDSRCTKYSTLLTSGKNSDKVIIPVYDEKYPAAIAYTSGSSGTCKGVISSNDAFNAMAVQIKSAEKDIQVGDSMFTTLPLWIYYSLVNSCHSPLSWGVTVALDPIFNPNNIDKRLKKYKFQYWETIPCYVEAMANNEKITKEDTKCIKAITTGGDYLKPETQKLAKDRFGLEIEQGYGFSETIGCFAYTYEEGFTKGSVGKPLLHNKCKILDLDSNEEVEEGKTGEMYISGPTLMSGYVGNSDAEENSIVVDKDGVRWFKTGDLMHTINGELFYDGRIRRIVITKDNQGLPTKVIPDKIKRVMSKHPSIKNVEIITIPDEERVNVTVAYVILNEGYDMSNQLLLDINNFCEQNLPSYSIPIDVIPIGKFPVNSGKKNDILKLTEDYLESHNTTKTNMVRSMSKKQKNI